MKAAGREKEEEFSRSRPYECVLKEGGGNQVKNFEEESQTSSCETIEKHQQSSLLRVGARIYFAEYPPISSQPPHHRIVRINSSFLSLGVVVQLNRIDGNWWKINSLREIVEGEVLFNPFDWSSFM